MYFLQKGQENHEECAAKFLIVKNVGKIFSFLRNRYSCICVKNVVDVTSPFQFQHLPCTAQKGIKPRNVKL